LKNEIVMVNEEDILKFINIRDLVFQQRLDLVLQTVSQSEKVPVFRVIMKE